MHVTLHAPYQQGRNTILAGSLELDTGDELRIEAVLTPATLARARQLGVSYGNRVMDWARESIEIQGDWGKGAFGRAAAAVIARTGMHPVINAPGVGPGKAIQAAVSNRREELTRDLPPGAYDDAERLLAARRLFETRECYDLLRVLRHRALNGDAASWALLGACHDSGACCCNEKQIRSSYDLGWAIEQSPAEVPHRIALAASDAMAARSKSYYNGQGAS